MHTFSGEKRERDGALERERDGGLWGSAGFVTMFFPLFPAAVLHCFPSGGVCDSV